MHKVKALNNPRGSFPGFAYRLIAGDEVEYTDLNDRVQRVVVVSAEDPALLTVRVKGRKGPEYRVGRRVIEKVHYVSKGQRPY